jgi:hypothetical protein
MNVAFISSVGQCGVREYAHMLMEGFRDLGHRVHYIGIERHNNRDLVYGLRQVRFDDELVIVEYEPGIFWLWGVVRAMAWLRCGRRKRVMFSVHEIAPERYYEGRQIQWHLSRPVLRSRWLEVLKLVLCVGDVLFCFLKYRIGLLLMGWLPHVVLVHSPKALENVKIALVDDKVYYVPLIVQHLEGDRDTLRRELGLPLEPFAFIVPGFLFRRKRIVDVIEQLVPDAELWIVGTESPFDPGYLSEIHAHLAQSVHRDQVRLIHDYERLEQYLLAADAAIFYYSECFQSAAASLAVGAGKPCILADLPAFSDLSTAGLAVRTPDELHQAMIRIQDPAVYDLLAESARTLREQLSNKRIAERYLESLGIV